MSLQTFGSWPSVAMQSINFAISRRLPVVSGWAVLAKSGALLTYGLRLVESYRRPAYYVRRIP